MNLLVSQFESEEILPGYRGYNSLNSNEKSKMLLPYINTTLLINELINLQSEIKGVNIKVKEKSGMRKDRFSSIQYNIWVCAQLEQKLNKPKSSTTIDYSTLYRKPSIAHNKN